MAPLRITLATEDYDRVRALKDGRVAIEGCAVEHLTLHPAEMFSRLFTRHEFDVSEMSFSTYLVALAKGEFPYVALPVFPSRAFVHSSIYVRTDRAIVAPADLRGRTGGIALQPVTATEQSDSHWPSFIRQQPRHNKAVAAIVARTT